MRKSILIILFALLNVLIARAYDFEVDGIYYNIISGTDQVEVTYGNTNFDKPTGRDYTGSVVIPTTVTYNGENYRVTAIGYMAFYACTGLTSVTVPESVTTIGDFAFIRTSISGPLYHNKVFAYMPQSYSGEYVIPSGIQSIVGGAFEGCGGLTSVTIPESVTSIGPEAFAVCSGLTSVTIPEGVDTIRRFTFYECSGLTSVTIGESVTFIGDYAFAGCSGLTSVMIPESVTTIREFAFYGCTGLTSVTIPNSVTSIGSCVFGECSGLTSVTIPESVTFIGSGAFVGCNGLTSVTIPESVTEIGNGAFLECTGLTSITSMAENPPLCADNAFASEGYCVIPLYVPAGSKLFYSVSLGWRRFAKIEELEAKTYKVTMRSNDADMGMVTGGGDYKEGEQTMLVAIPHQGYYFARWDDGNLNNPRILTVSGDTTITAVFAKEEIDVPVIYTVTMRINDADMGMVTGGGDYKEGEQAMLVAIPYQGYYFARWDDGNTNNPRILTVSGDTTITAIFAKDEQDEPVVYTVTVQSNNAAMGSVTGGGDYASGAQAILVAVPNKGYYFDRWDDGNTNNPRILTVSGDTTITAVFAKDEQDEPVVYTVTVQPNDAAMGSVTGGGDYASGAQAILVAVPNKGYYFDRWDDGNTNNPRILTVSGDTTITAIFAKYGGGETPNENLEADNFRVYVQDRTIHLSEARGLVQVYNMAGQCVYNGHATAIPVPQSGVYIVAVGSQRFKVLVR